MKAQTITTSHRNGTTTGPLSADLCVIGAGAGGLSVAAGAAQLGVDTILIERAAMGGDCLNAGCVPSKALLAAARAAAAVREAGRFGIQVGEPTIDFTAVHHHVQATIAGLAPHDSVERFEGLGVRVIQADAAFIGPRTVQAGSATITARRFVIATGSHPARPNLPGLDRVPWLTNETLFQRPRTADPLIILGGGPIGVEMAQAHRRLGCPVTLIECATLLPRDDPELVAILRRRLVQEGVVLLEQSRVARLEPGAEQGLSAVLEDGRTITGAALLVATGRRPTLETLNLSAAGIETTADGIVTDSRLRTRNPAIFAIGDVVAGAPRFTHVAGYHAGIVLRNALFRWPARVDLRALPWVTYTSPEVAQVGLTEAQARATLGKITVLRWPLADNDRAHTDRVREGLVKAIVRPNGRVVGASLIADHAGELIQPWSLAITAGLNISTLANLIAPYPTLAEANKRAASSFFTPRLFNDRVRWLVRMLARLG